MSIQLAILLHFHYFYMQVVLNLFRFSYNRHIDCCSSVPFLSDMPAIYYYYFLNFFVSLISSLCDVCAGLNVCVASVKKKMKL